MLTVSPSDVDHYVEPSELTDRPTNRLIDRRPVGDVDSQCEMRPRASGQLSLDLSGSVQIEIRDDYSGAFTCKPMGAGPADPVCPTGD